MGFNHIKGKGKDFESFKSELEDAIESLEELCEKVEEMEEEFGERDGGGGGGMSNRGGSYNERDAYMRGEYSERRGRRGR